MTRTLNPFHSGSNAKPSPASTPTCVPRPGGVGCLRSVKVAFSAAYRKPAATSRRHQVPLTPQAETFFPVLLICRQCRLALGPAGLAKLTRIGVESFGLVCLSMVTESAGQAEDASTVSSHYYFPTPVGKPYLRVQLDSQASTTQRQRAFDFSFMCLTKPGWGSDLPCDYLPSAWQDLKESLRGSGLYPDYFYARYPKSTRGK